MVYVSKCAKVSEILHYYSEPIYIMAEGKEELKVGSIVLVKDKSLEGVVKFLGTTLFAPGKWIGIELYEPKGKNDGTIQGKAYFQCPENYGLMVRQNQVQVCSSHVTQLVL